MKKSLLAVAAMGAFASAAQAQSSVTVYGILDVGFVGGHQKASNGTLRTNQVVENSVGQQFTGSGAQSTSRLGFRGTEDLGKGMSAFFTIETALTPNNQVIFGTGGSANRQVFAGLGQKGVGRLAIGSQYTPMFTNVSTTSPGQLNNVMGDLIFASNNTTDLFAIPGAPSAAAAGNRLSSATMPANNANGSNDVGFTVRAANMIRFDSDSISGFRGQAFYVMDNATTRQTGATANSREGGINNRNGWGLGANYTLKKFFVAANYQSLTATNPYNAAANAIVTTSGGVSTVSTAAVAAAGQPEIFGTSVNTGLNIKDNQWFAGAMYDFGILKAYAQYINRKATSQINATEFATRTAQQIGVRGNWTPKVESWASIGTGRYDSFGTSQPTVNFNGYQLGTNYILSKRTNLYGIYGATNTGTSSAGSYFNGSQYAVGVRHTF